MTTSNSTKVKARLDFGKLAWMLVKALWKIGALMKLQKRCQFAASELAKVLVKVVGGG